jgi:hypothetical protein
MKIKTFSLSIRSSCVSVKKISVGDEDMNGSAIKRVPALRCFDILEFLLALRPVG